MKGFNIRNNNKRMVKCTCTGGSYFGENGNLLVKGNLYHVVHVVTGRYNTTVYLAEFPEIGFNSVHFSELC